MNKSGGIRKPGILDSQDVFTNQLFKRNPRELYADKRECLTRNIEKDDLKRIVGQLDRELVVVRDLAMKAVEEGKVEIRRLRVENELLRSML